MDNPADGVSKCVEEIPTDDNLYDEPLYPPPTEEIPTDDNLYDDLLCLPPTGKKSKHKRVTGAGKGDLKNTNSHTMDHPAYGVSTSVEYREMPMDDNLYELVDLPRTGKINNRKGVTTGKINNRKGVTGAAQGDLKNTNSRKAGLVTGIISFFISVLAIVVGMVSVGLTIALNSNSEIQSLAVTVNNLQLSLNQSVNLYSNSEIQSLTAAVNNLQLSLTQSVNAIEDLGYQFSALQTKTATNTQFSALNQTVNSIMDTIREHSDLLNKLSWNRSVNLNSNSEMQSLTAVVNNLQLSLNESVNTVEDLGHQISALQAKTVTKSQCSALNQTVNNIQDTIHEHSDLLNQLSLNQSLNLNSNTEIQSLTAAVNNFQLSLNQSVNNIEDLGHQISPLQTKTATKSQFSVLNQTVNTIQDTIREDSDFFNMVNSKGSIKNPLKSCSDIPIDRPSGEYWILRNSSLVQVYCDMTRTCCNTTGGWIRVANLDMTDPNQRCPDEFLQHNESMEPLRTCARHGLQECVSTTFPVHGIEYSRVCGRVIGYQFGSTDAFILHSYHPNQTLNDNYVDGVSLTHGQSPPKHIWTFAAAADEIETRVRLICPCTQPNNTKGRTSLPPFISQDYFCDTGSRNAVQVILYPNDPLWDGRGCGGTSTCCSFNNPPWFCKQLPQPTTDNIKLRLCLNQDYGDEDIFLEIVNIFVQ